MCNWKTKFSIPKPNSCVILLIENVVHHAFHVSGGRCVYFTERKYSGQINIENVDGWIYRPKVVDIHKITIDVERLRKELLGIINTTVAHDKFNSLKVETTEEEVYNVLQELETIAKLLLVVKSNVDCLRVGEILREVRDLIKLL